MGHEKEGFKKCFIDAKDKNLTAYVCFAANNERVSGVLDNNAKHIKFFLERLKIYDNQIKSMGPVNECERYNGCCDR